MLRRGLGPTLAVRRWRFGRRTARDGRCFPLPLGRAFRIASDLTLTATDFKAIIAGPLQGGVFTYNGGGECFGVGGQFALGGNHADMLLSILPPIVHIRKESDRAELRWLLERMMEELRSRSQAALSLHNTLP